MNNQWKRILSGALSLILALQIAGAAGVSVQADEVGQTAAPAAPDAVPADDTGYLAYQAAHASAGYTGETVTIGTGDFIGGEQAELGRMEGRDAVLTQEEGGASWHFQVETTGLYRVRLSYYPMEGTGTNIQRTLQLDGQTPFDEAAVVELGRVYVDAEEIVVGANGDDIRPDQVEQPGWLTAYVRDQFHYYGAHLYLYIEAGAHTLTLLSEKEPMAVEAITLESTETALPTYADALEAYQQAGAPVIQGVLAGGHTMTQAEDTFAKSDPTLYPTSERQSSATVPFDPVYTRLNIVGGTQWSTVGQWIEWKIEAPQAGLYQIGLRSRQNQTRDNLSTRTLYINGTVPFQEAQALTFSYSDKWKVAYLGDGRTPYLFYLKEGENIIRLEVDLGEIATYIQQAERILTRLNSVNLQLLSLLGATPDPYRNYRIEAYMPEAIEELETLRTQLQEVIDAFVRMSGTSDASLATLVQLEDTLERMTADPDHIPRQYGNFKDSLGTMGDWLISIKSQPLQLDYLLLGEQGAELPPAEDHFFIRFWNGLLSFFASFTRDYSMMSGGETAYEGEPLDIWIGNGLSGGRDQAQALNKIINQDFSARYHIPVSLKLVAANSIITSTLAGKGPDVALQVASTNPVDFAMRNAVADLTQFEDFDEVASRFFESALTPYVYQGGAYALPETFSFLMMFYRKDILSDLGINIESIKTWQDVVDVLPELHNRNMNFALPVTTATFLPTFSMLVFQAGGAFYNEADTASALDAPEVLDIFDFWMNLYIHEGLPYEYNFENRFRTGEIPIGIADYTTYNLLSISAPEIKGQWGMVEVPGIERADGTIDNTSSSTGAACILMSDCRDPEAAWEFMKWWTSADIQYAYGKELESSMGTAARYNTANVEAFGRLPWTAADRRTLLSQAEKLQGIEQVPGGYYTSRSVDFAIRAVYNEGKDPRETLKRYVRQINEEIRIKREEFGLPVE